MIRAENPPPLSQNLILGEKNGGEHPKLGKNSTNSDLAQNFRVAWYQQKNVIRAENLSPPLSQNSILGKKSGSTPNQAKIQLTRIWLKLSG